MINPCVECGSLDVFVERQTMVGMPEGHNNPTFAVKCRKCYRAIDAGYSTRETAITVWNRLNKPAFNLEWLP